MSDTTEPSPGWYPDPTNVHEFRYWDGVGWSSYVVDNGVQLVERRSRPKTTEAEAIAADHILPKGVSSWKQFRRRPAFAQLVVWSAGVLVIATLIGAPIYVLKQEGHADNSDRAQTQSVSVKGTSVDSDPTSSVATTAPTTTHETIASSPLVTESNCHPSYIGDCIPRNVPDVDCVGTSGDGPFYTGPVQVVGPDAFDLDPDGDGRACE